MKNIYMLLSIILIVFVVAGCSSSEEKENTESNSSAKALIASSGYPHTDGSVETFSVPLLEKVMEKTDEVEFNIFTGGELFSADESLDALNSTSIDIEMVLSPTLDQKRFPYSSVVGLPLLKSDASVAAKAIQKMVESDVEIADGKTYYELEFADKDLFVLPIHPTETYLISTVDEKLDSVDKFNKSIRIRASSNVHETFINELGLTPVALPAPDIYDSLSRNAIDGVMLNIPDWPPYGVDELTNYTLSGVSLGHFPVFFAMNQDTWDSFSDDVQNIFKEEANELIQSGPETYKQQIEEILPNYNGELIEFDSLDKEVQDKINTAILNTWNSWIKDLEDRGFAGKEVALLWRDLIVESGGEVPQEILDME
ncbi:hypothetical protein ACFSKI_03485 [Pseudogracilibacillus auburnensis]|uniref:TRAP-type C4-dicarboxylate transport system substrate-binding protein n=1 Tax=Pseudogracilibacillus auburnensis TaxID=1494959 RepID=A0A2V3W1S6_9BACI|nr:hypothetical protein [Pseudogracilibacillus auburnensis]PXW88032.1 TRAP-type C4-dicarboxylate transport system substrate-binding protein [Pseudogracilibacillus auburnensis]